MLRPLAAVVLVLACAPPELEPSESRHALAGERVVTPIVTRRGSAPTTRYLATTCAEGGDACAEPTELLLLADPAAALPFGATAQGSYEGCGPQAVANYLGWVTGGRHHVAHVRPHVPSIDFPGRPVATTPDAIRDGLTTLLAAEGHDYDVVWGHGGGSRHAPAGPELGELKQLLREGFPLIILVEGGHHWQVVTGYRAPDLLFVVDYQYRPSADGASWVRIADFDPAEPELFQGEWRRFDDLGFGELDGYHRTVEGFGNYYRRSFVGIRGLR